MALLDDNIPDVAKTEITFNIDNFKKPKVLNNLHAKAQKFLNLLKTIPGTYPDHPDLGVNIDQYMFEYLTSENLLKIQEHIKRQVDTYMPDSGINLILVQRQEDSLTGRNNTIGIAISLVDEYGRAAEMFYFITREVEKGTTRVIVDYDNSEELQTKNQEGMIY